MSKPIVTDGLTLELKYRYLTDDDFHARVEVVARSLWSTMARVNLGHRDPYSYDRLSLETQEDLIGYAIEAVDALDARREE